MSWNLKVQQILPYKKPNKQQQQQNPLQLKKSETLVQAQTNLDQIHLEFYQIRRQIFYLFVWSTQEKHKEKAFLWSDIRKLFYYRATNHTNLY